MQKIVQKLKNPENVFQKPLRLTMKLTAIRKKYFAKLFVLDHRGLTWFNGISQVSFSKLCSGQIRHFTNSPFVTFNYSICGIPYKIFFFSKISDLSKNIALLIGINQYCHTVHFYFLVLLFHL